MKKSHIVLSALALSALALTGCASGEEAGESATVSSSPASDMGGMHGSGSPEVGAEHNEADTMFAQMMIPHHEQAVEMSEAMLANNTVQDTRILDLANKIKAAQGPEIQTMTSMLDSWSEPAQPMEGMDHSMEGMMGPEDMAALKTAEGDEAARLFLTQMIAHHQGAVAMAETEVADGKNPEALALARKIINDQKAEITAMEEMLPSYQ